MGRQLPGISSELRDALDQLDVLTDEEQDIVDSWLRSGYRTSLYEVGIGDDVIGPHRSDIEDHPADAPALPPALTKIANVPPSARLISALCSLQAVSKLEFDAIANWFKFENRAPCTHWAQMTKTSEHGGRSRMEFGRTIRDMRLVASSQIRSL